MATHNIFFGTYSKGPGKGLFRGLFDGDSGEIRLTGTLDIENPSYMQLNGNVLYGVSEINEFNNENGGALFAVDISSELRLLGIQATHGKSPCHLCVKDNFIFVSNYSEGSLSIFEIETSCSIQPSTQSLHHFGMSVRPDRQKASHVHFASMTPDGKYLALCDLGMDMVFLYPYAAGNGLSTKAIIINCPAGSGPRHLAFSNYGNYLYVLTELGNTILSYDYKDGEAGFLQEITTLPPGFAGNTTSAAIHISPDGTYVASSNRGHDSIAVFKIADDGRLKFTTHVMTGKTPRDFNFSPCGKWLLSANQNDDSVTVFSINSGDFKQTGTFQIPKPVCVLFG